MARPSVNNSLGSSRTFNRQTLLSYHMFYRKAIHSIKRKIEHGAVHEKIKGLRKFLGFIDGKVDEISRPKGSLSQQDVYNEHRKNHLKFQVSSN